MSKTDEQLRAEGVTIAEATGYAGGTGPLGPKIEEAMGNAALACNARGIADDCPSAKLVEIVGAGELKAMFGDAYETKIGADYIRECKIRERKRVKDEHRAELDEHQRAAAAELAKQGQ